MINEIKKILGFDKSQQEIKYINIGTKNNLINEKPKEIIELEKALEEVEQLKKSKTISSKTPTVIQTTFLPLLQYSNYKAPLYSLPFWYISKLYNQSDIFKNVCRSIKTELLKNGLEIVPRFTKKCKDCGATYERDVEVCLVCGSKNLVEPSLKQKEKLEKFLSKSNSQNLSFIEILEQIEDNLNVFDNAYLLLVKKYGFDQNGELVKSETKEVVSLDPAITYKIFNSAGQMGVDEEGRELRFCPNSKCDAFRKEILYSEKCPYCGTKTMKACYVVDRATSPNAFNYFSQGSISTHPIYYSDKEVIHLTKYHIDYYGYPLVLNVWEKVVTLILIDRYLNKYFALQRPPKALLAVKTPNAKSFEKFWVEYETKIKENPHRLVPIVINTTDTKSSIFEYIELSKGFDEAKVLEIIDLYRTQIASLFGVSTKHIGSQSYGGLNNDSLEFALTTRAIKLGQVVYNQKLFPFLCDSIGIRDWTIRLVSPETTDELNKIKLAEEKVKLAEMLIKAGYNVNIKMNKRYEIELIMPDDKTHEPITNSKDELKGPSPTNKPQEIDGEPMEGHKVEAQNLDGKPTVRRKRNDTTQ